jgi:hypothetical protein
MPDLDRGFDEILRGAFAEGIPEPHYDADSAKEKDVPDDLRAQLLARASTESGRLFAERVLEAAERVGWTSDELAQEAIGVEREAAQLLRGHGDPRLLTSQGLARMLWRAELDPFSWSELLTQLVASMTLFPTPLHGEVWGRTTGLSDAERGEALAEDVERDPVRAKRVADLFVEEVIDEWTSLTLGETTTEDEGLK